MEESNIRWGEIIGGLLITVARPRWSWLVGQDISIPVLKFLIFTVTAVLFGIGLWNIAGLDDEPRNTDHRRSFLNFLAIAAVSSSTVFRALVIGSELIAPAVFLCLVYFAGRVIAPGCAHLLSAGVLGSSVGQLLVRHLAAVDIAPSLLIFLGAFPLVCYVLTVRQAMRVLLADREIDENETGTLFTMLGTMSFAALLPFALLRDWSLGLTMMYLAPRHPERAAAAPSGLCGAARYWKLVARTVERRWSARRRNCSGWNGSGMAQPASIVPAALLNCSLYVLAVTLTFLSLIARGGLLGSPIWCCSMFWPDTPANLWRRFDERFSQQWKALVGRPVCRRLQTGFCASAARDSKCFVGCTFRRLISLFFVTLFGLSTHRSRRSGSSC